LAFKERGFLKRKRFSSRVSVMSSSTLCVEGRCLYYAYLNPCASKSLVDHKHAHVRRLQQRGSHTVGRCTASCAEQPPTHQPRPTAAHRPLERRKIVSKVRDGRAMDARGRGGKCDREKGDQRSMLCGTKQEMQWEIVGLNCHLQRNSTQTQTSSKPPGGDRKTRSDEHNRTMHATEPPPKAQPLAAPICGGLRDCLDQLEGEALVRQPDLPLVYIYCISFFSWVQGVGVWCGDLIPRSDLKTSRVPGEGGRGRRAAPRQRPLQAPRQAARRQVRREAGVGGRGAAVERRGGRGLG
jgi:hypothetical protein